jgi:Gon7 family
MPSPAASKSTLRATYTYNPPSSSPNQTHVFTHPISSPLPFPASPTAVKDKVHYLSELRASTKRLQEEVNVFLTQKMDEDKAGQAAEEKEKKAAAAKSQDELEEERYGEEEGVDDEEVGV